LPRATALKAEYERGVGFWIPGGDMALFYNHDDSVLPSPGLIVVAKVTSGLEIFNKSILARWSSR